MLTAATASDAQCCSTNGGSAPKNVTRLHIGRSRSNEESCEGANGKLVRGVDPSRDTVDHNGARQTTPRDRFSVVAEETPQTWRLCPVPNSHALLAVAGVALYSGGFLLYAQRHSIVLFIMTGLIAICIVCLYTSGLVCVLYMMLSVNAMECAGHSHYHKMSDKPSVATICTLCSTCSEEETTNGDTQYMTGSINRVEPQASARLASNGTTRIAIFDDIHRKYSPRRVAVQKL